MRVSVGLVIWIRDGSECLDLFYRWGINDGTNQVSFQKGDIGEISGRSKPAAYKRVGCVSCLSRFTPGPSASIMERLDAGLFPWLGRETESPLFGSFMNDVDRRPENMLRRLSGEC